MTPLAKRRLIGLGAITVAGSVLAAMSFGSLDENIVYYLSPSELMERGSDAQGQLVRLGGLVMPGSFDLDNCDPGCEFRVTDGKTEVEVHSTGMPPQMFREGIGVVVEGELKGATFHTERIMVKHSNEYEAPKDGEKPAMTTMAE